MKRPGAASTILIGAVAAVLLSAASLLGLGVLRPLSGQQPVTSQACAPPVLPGTTVGVTESDMGGMMSGAPAARTGRLIVQAGAVPRGQVSFVVTNRGRLAHEFLVLPLPAGHAPGERPVGGDGRIDEAGLVAEASASCAAGAGEGIVAGAAGWVTAYLAAGHYELVCNLPGHYAAGMYAELTVV